jgi:hypothetical protein
MAARSEFFKGLEIGEVFQFWSFRDCPHGLAGSTTRFEKIGPREYMDGDGERYCVTSGKVLVLVGGKF